MKPVRIHCCISFCAVVLAFAGATPAYSALAKTDAGTAVSETEARPFTSMNEALVTVVVDDVKGFVGKARKLLGQIIPERADALLRRQFGHFLGDLKLQALEEGKGAALVVFPKGARVAFVEVSPEKAEAYATALASRGAHVAKADGMLILSQRDDVVTAGKAIVREVRENLLGTKRAHGLQVEVPIGRLLARYDTQLKGAVTGLSAAMRMRQQMTSGGNSGVLAPTTATMSLLELELRMLHRLMKRLDKVQLAVDLPAEGVRLDFNFVPNQSGEVAGTSPKGTLSAAKVMNFVPARGAMRFAMVADVNNMGSFLEKELGAALEETRIDPAMRDGMMKLVRDWTTVVGNATAADMLIPGKTFVSGSTVVEIRDPKRFLKLVEGLPAQLKASGIDRFYAEMGMPIESEVAMNVREVKGLPVHRFTIRFTAAGGGPQAAMMKAMMGDAINYDFAIVDKYVVYALGGESVGELIDAVKSGGHPDAKPTDAEKFFGPNASLYCDYNIGRLLTMMADTLPRGALPPNAFMGFKGMANAVSDAPPLAIGGFSEEGRFRVSVMVPVEMISKFVEGGKAVNAAKSTGKQSRRARMPESAVESEETTATAPSPDSEEKNP